MSITTGLLFGLLPAFRGSGLKLSTTLHGNNRHASSGKNTQRLRNLLVIAEIAISLVLLAGAALTVRSFRQLRDADLGFRTDHIATARVTIPTDKYVKDEQVASFYDRVLERVRTMPGVESVGLVSYLPLTGHNFDNSFDIVGQPAHAPDDRSYPLVRFVDPQYFGVLSIPLLAGRGFDEHDRLGAVRSMIVSQSMATRFFPGKNPLGQHLIVYMGDDQSPWQIVGIVGDARSDIAAPAEPTMYFPYDQFPYRYMVLTVRTHTEPGSVLDSVRRAVDSVDPDEPVYQARTLDELIDESLVPWRFSMTLLSVFAAMALLLAAAGIYGVMAYLVLQRTHEVGVRMDLGARPGDVLRLVVTDGARLVLLGVLLGLVISFALTGLMAGLLFNVSAADPTTLGLVACLLVLVALAACYVPARRAAKVDPIVALRHE
jgi:putative ABC transport system permease protein